MIGGVWSGMRRARSAVVACLAMWLSACNIVLGIDDVSAANGPDSGQRISAATADPDAEQVDAASADAAAEGDDAGRDSEDAQRAAANDAWR